MAEAEEWRPIPGAPHYFASSLGRIGSEKRKGNGISGEIKPLKPYDQGHYARVQLSTGAKNKGRFVHRLVAAAWHGVPDDPKLCVLHRDGNRWNNRPENLYWGKPSDNAQDRLAHNIARPPTMPGSRGYPLSLKLAVLRDLAETNMTVSAIARQYGVERTTIIKWRKNPDALKPRTPSYPERISVYEVALAEIEGLARNYMAAGSASAHRLARIHDVVKHALPAEVLAEFAAPRAQLHGRG